MAEPGPAPAQVNPSATSHWIISLRSVAIVMGVFGLTCLGVLVVVTAIDDADALSTVALALAILAFSVQLIVFIAQQNLASEQARRNEELYGSMQGLLAEIKEKAAGTQADVRTINERMLGAILSKSIASAPEGRVDYQALMSQLAQATEPESDSSASAGPDDERSIWPNRRPGPHDQEHLETLKTFPSEDEVGESMSVLEALTDVDRQGLKSFGDDEVIALQPGFPFDPALTLASVGGLQDLGLVEPYPPERQPDEGSRIYRLTDRGRSVARLLTAQGEAPAYLPGLQAIRDATPDRLSWQGQWRDGA